jgi:hypothetical protein
MKSCHGLSSTLPLLVTGVLGANNADDALAADDLAVFTPGFDGCFDFHFCSTFAYL